MDIMSAYQIPQPLSGQTHLEGYGHVEFDYPAGVVEPSDDQESALLELLLTNGHVSIATAKTKAKSATKSDQPLQEQE